MELATRSQNKKASKAADSKGSTSTDQASASNPSDQAPAHSPPIGTFLPYFPASCEEWRANRVRDEDGCIHHSRPVNTSEVRTDPPPDPTAELTANAALNERRFRDAIHSQSSDPHHNALDFAAGAAVIHDSFAAIKLSSSKPKPVPTTPAEPVEQSTKYSLDAFGYPVRPQSTPDHILQKILGLDEPLPTERMRDMIKQRKLEAQYKLSQPPSGPPTISTNTSRQSTLLFNRDNSSQRPPAAPGRQPKAKSATSAPPHPESSGPKLPYGNRSRATHRSAGVFVYPHPPQTRTTSHRKERAVICKINGCPGPHAFGKMPCWNAPTPQGAGQSPERALTISTLPSLY